MKKNTLKKLGLGASAFACLMSTGMSVSAAEKTGTTTVTYDNRTIIDGGDAGTSGTASWGAYIPTTITLDGSLVGTTNTIDIVEASGGVLADAFDELTIKATVASKNGYTLNDVTDTTKVNYTLRADGNDSEFGTIVSDQEFTQRLGIGTSTASGDSSNGKKNEQSVTLLTKITDDASSLAQGSYSDTLTFKFTELNRIEK